MLSPYHPMQLALGLIVWALWFTAVYGGVSVACAVAPPPVAQGAMTWINAALLFSTLFTVALLLHWAHRAWRVARNGAAHNGADGDNLPRRHIVWVGMGVHLAGALATFSVGAVVIALPPCV